jgi:hypothetical protein
MWIAGSALAILVIVHFWPHGSSSPAPAPKSMYDAAPTLLPAVNVILPPTSDKPTPPLNINSIDVCGHGRIAIDPDDPYAASRYVSSLTDKAKGRWLSALLDSGDIRARAAGLYMVYVDGKRSGGGKAQPIAEQSRDALVQLAAGAGDPAIYAMAVYACDTYSNAASSESCREISLKDWAKLDPDNAVPWLLLTGKAQKSNDLAAESTAFAEAAKARKVDDYNYSLYAYGAPDMPTDATPLERWFLASEVIGIEGATAQFHYSIGLKHCSADAVRDVQVRQQCNALAELLVSQGTTLIDLGMGAAIGNHVGWNKARLAGLAEERQALMQSITAAIPTENEELWSCEGARRGNVYMGQWASLGEIGAGRELLDRSGDTVPELAKKHREHMEKTLRDAQQRLESAEEPPP